MSVVSKSSKSVASPSFAQVLAENSIPKSSKQDCPTFKISDTSPITPKSEFEVLILSPSNNDSVPNTETINVMGKVKKAVEKKLENLCVPTVRA